MSTKIMGMLTCAGLIGVAQAADWKLGVSAGITNGGDTENPEFAPGIQLVVQSAAGVIPGLPGLAVFGEAGYTKLSDSISFSEDGLKAESSLDMDVATLAAGATYAFAGGVSLYGLAGIGYYRPDYSGDFDTSALDAATGVPGLTSTVNDQFQFDDGIGAMVGAGIQYQVTPKIELFTDYRIHSVDLKGSGDTIITVNAPGHKTEEFVVADSSSGTRTIGVARVGVGVKF